MDSRVPRKHRLAILEIWTIHLYAWLIPPRPSLQCTPLHRDNYINGRLPGQIACLSDNNEVWSDRLSDQIIRIELYTYGGL